MAIEITTNNVPRPVLYRWELTAKESAEFDYLAPDEGTFFRYRGETYDLGEFSRVDRQYPGQFPEGDPFRNWDGYQSDSYFSGILVRYCEDPEWIVVGRYFS